MSWYTMDLIGDCTVVQRIEETPTFLSANSLPPFLVFHIFTEVIKAPKVLQEHKLCHADLWNGTNVMLSPPAIGGRWPGVKLIDAIEIVE